MNVVYFACCWPNENCNSCFSLLVFVFNTYQMRRACPQIAAVVASGAQTRQVYSIYHTTVHETQITKGEADLSRATSVSKVRGFDFAHVPVVTANNRVLGGEFISRMSAPEVYLYSAIQEDIKRLMGVDWTYDFDSMWRDRVDSHHSLYRTLYNRSSMLLCFLVGDASANKEGRQEMDCVLNQLDSTLKWAEETERCYSAIAKARFQMQREVFEAFEREKILAGCVEVVENFKASVPSEFRRKACAELDFHLGNMRHWVWDCPNAKRTFPRQLA